MLIAFSVGNVWGEIAYGTYVVASSLEADAHYILTGVKNSTTTYSASNVNNNNNRKTVAVTVNSNGSISVASNSTVCTFTLGGSSNAWTLCADNYIVNNKVTDNCYLRATSSSSNNLGLNANALDDNARWTIGSFNSGTASLVANGTNSRKKARFNPNGNNDAMIGAYATNTTVGTDIKFYRKAVQGASNNTNYGTISVSGDVITASPKSGYQISSTNPYTITPTGKATVSRTNNVFTLTNVSALVTLTVNFEAATPAHTITPATNDANLGTVTMTGNVITASPADGCRLASPAYEVTVGTASVSQTGNEFTVTPSSDCTVQINFEEIPSHNIKFNIDGGSVTPASVSVKEGETYSTLPSVTGLTSSCEYGTFVGWKEGNSINPSVKPDLVTSVTMEEDDVDLYAVYSKTEGGSGASVGTTLFSENFTGASGAPTSPTTGATTYGQTITYECTDGTSDTKIYDADLAGGASPEILVGKSGGSFAVSNISTGGATSLTLTYQTNNTNITLSTSSNVSAGDISYNSTTKVATATITVSSGSAFDLTFVGGSGNSRLDNISIVVAEGGGTTTYSLDANCCTPRAITASGVGGELTLAPNLAEACAGTAITLTANSPDGSHEGTGTIKVIKTGVSPEVDVTADVYSAGTLTMPDYEITITATYAEKSTPSVSVTPAVLDFGSPKKGDAVTEQTFSLSGSALVAGTLTLVAPEGFTLSPSSIDVAAGSLSATEITVTPNTETAGDKSGNITISGAGIALTNLVALTMTVQETYTVNWYINNDVEPYAHQTDIAGTTLTIPDDFSSFTDCQDLSFVGWSESAIGSSPAAEKPTFAEVGTTITANKNYYAVFAEGSAGGTTWTRVTATSTLLAGGTFIMGYEATANSNVIVPMQNSGTLTTTAAGYIYSGTGTSGSDNTGTINMSETVESSSKYEITVVASEIVEGAVNIKFGDNFVGNENTKNNAKLFSADAETTAFTLTKGNNDAFTLDIAANTSGSAYRYLKYNTGSPRFAVYSTTSEKLVFYKKSTSADTYHNWVTVCPHCNSVALSKAGESAGNTFALQRNSADVTSVNTCAAVTVDVVASPATGYELTKIVVSGVTGASVNEEFTQISIPQNAEGTLTVTATFSQKNYEVIVEEYPVIGATLTGATTTAHYNDEITISTNEPAGYKFSGWCMYEVTDTERETDIADEFFTGDYDEYEFATTAKFKMPNRSIVAEANFKKIYSVNEFMDTEFTKTNNKWYYVTGLVAEVPESLYSGTKMTYVISDDATKSGLYLTLYRGLGEDGENFSAVSDLAVGDKVVVYGQWSSSYKNLNEGNYILKDCLTKKALSALTITGDASVTTYDVGDSFDKTGLSLTATYNTGYVIANYTGTTITSDYDAPTTFTAGVTKVTVSAEEGLISTSRDIPVTVSSAVLDHVEISAAAQTEFWAKEQYKEPLLDAYLTDDPATILQNVTGVSNTEGLDMSEAGNKSVTVTYTRKLGQSDDVEYNFTVKAVVVDEAHAHSVATAREIIDLDNDASEDLNLADNATKTHVKGIVKSVQLNSGLTGGNAQYNGTYNIVITDEADATKEMTLYRVSLKSGITSVEENDLIKACGNLYWYEGGSKYEINTGGQVVWKQPKVNIEISNQTMEVGETLTIADVATIDPAAAPVSYAIVANYDNCITLNESTGLITAIATGTATVSISANDYEEYLANSKTFTVTVKPAAVHTNVVLYVEFGGNYYAVNNEGEATQIDVLGGKVVVANEATKNKIVWDCAEREGAATFYNITAAKYLNGSNSTTLGVAASEGTYTNWTWTEDKYYTSNPGASTVRTFLYQGNATNFGNYAKSNAGKSTDGGYSNYATIYNGEVVIGTIETLREGATWTGEKWGTYCPRYNVKAMEGASFYQLNYMELNADGSPYKFFFDEIGEGANLEAGKPYLFITEEDVTTIKGVKYGDAAADGLHVYNGFVGYLGSGNYDLSSDNNVYTAGANNYYGLQNNVFTLIYGTNSYMIDERAFVQITPSSKPATTEQPAPAYSRRRLVVGAGAPQVATGIDALNASDAPAKVLINGQLFIIRGEKMFDAKGQLVK